MRSARHEWLRLCGLLSVLLAGSLAAQTTNWSVVGWNNLGMHCMDSDFAVFAILPPYNTIHAQVIAATNGHARLVTDAPGISVTYQAAVDPDGSINRSSVGKGNFWAHSAALFGVSLPVDMGLPVPGPSFAMPGPANAPQSMMLESNAQWYAAYGVPITPYDDTQRRNAYPLMRLLVRRGAAAVATNDIVLPVSDEMDCRTCHMSGGGTVTPAAGWVWDPNPDRDYRLNILRLHDERQGTGATYRAALAMNGFLPDGLLATVLRQSTAILCARCHASEALPGSGIPGIPPLTAAVHGYHATAKDPVTGSTLNDEGNRSACYRCHPGAVTRCLRGAMGRAVAADGTLAMQCQSCHGRMSDVGAPGRTGWLDEPTCQSCHTGVATHNNGQIRYLSVYASNGIRRVAVDSTFATSSNAPAPGLSLYRFSRGHGGLYCEACHGSTHAEFPSSYRNDNLYSQRHQGHVGMLAECASCHGRSPDTVAGGPHGMHPIGLSWVGAHPGVVESNGWTRCKDCHGSDGKGTVLSRGLGDRTLTASLDGGSVTVRVWRGYQIGCYTCHGGPRSEQVTANQAPVVQGLTASTAVDVPLALGLSVSDPDGPLAVALRIVSQPDHGTVALVGTNATYAPFTGFAGTDTFTFAAWDGERDSNLATGRLAVAGGPCVADVAPLAFSFDERGGVAAAGVTEGPGCTWVAASDHRWVSVISGVDGIGTGIVWFAVEPNTSPASRAGTLTVAGHPAPVTQAGMPADSNGDGLPDSWQAAFFGSAASSNSAPAADPDGDGVPNVLEYAAGTVPTSSNSVLAVTGIDWIGVSTARVDFATSSNRLCQLETTDSLVSGYWVGFGAALTGDGGVWVAYDAAVSNRIQRFYRVRAYP